MNLGGLNQDVWAMIVAYTTPPDTRRLARTCHAAYAIAMPRILSEVELKLFIPKLRFSERRDCLTLGAAAATASFPTPQQITEQRITGFYACVLADAPRRCAYLRVLTPHGSAFDSPTYANGSQVGWEWSRAAPMADVLRHATCLRELHLNNMELVLRTQPALGTALAALPALDVLSFANPRQDALRWLAHAQSAPRTHDDSVYDSDRAALADALCAGGSFASRLETLCLSPASLAHAVLAAGAVFPSVRVLKLEEYAEALPHYKEALPPFTRAFPGVRRLRLVGYFCAKADVDAAWPELDVLTVKGRADVPVACRVRRLEIVRVRNQADVEELKRRTMPEEVVQVERE
ncbi:hypothetical protein WOLCODRAFT_161908 [Wolfiporia cocos MD-104 SS10]|uniref:F-box domain-containing protein n=1 Tax=Wolfiporia cocos (strain MD-104) TaxID=742152 RepID=A0A2H3JUL7_WOLCO|nr:hypothetical protein WOLCODRAFT_161908 [Wolfiporia cocos MD-104 SS10]